MSITRRKRDQFAKEYKIEAVRLIVGEGRSLPEVSHELGTAQSLLHRWKEKSQEGEIDPFPGKGRLSSEDEALRQLRRENKRLRIERFMLPVI